MLTRRLLPAPRCVAFALLMLAGGGRGLVGQEKSVEERLARLEQQVERLSTRLAAADSATVASLRQQLDAVLRELEALRFGDEPQPPVADGGAFGLAHHASRVYRTERGASLGGYGEVLYENPSATRQDGEESGSTAQLDALRAIVYVGYRFNERFLFNSEIEFEHGSTSATGSVSLEFAYVDLLLSPAVGVRAGLVLPPMGIINENHEPTTFLGTTRPETESRIIPSTWRENGIGVFGDVGDIGFRAFVVNGLDGSGVGGAASGFSGSGLRGGRQRGSRAIAEDLAVVGRIDYEGLPGVRAGASGYLGNSGQGARTESGVEVDARTLIWEGHLEYRARGLDLRGLIAGASVRNVSELNAVRGLDGTASIGERMLGGYVQAGYDLFALSDTPGELIPYVRWERIDTQAAVPDGFTASGENDGSILSLGVAWRPIPGIILKSDYQFRRNDARTGVDQFNVALGWAF